MFSIVLRLRVYTVAADKFGRSYKKRPLALTKMKINREIKMNYILHTIYYNLILCRASLEGGTISELSLYQLLDVVVNLAA